MVVAVVDGRVLLSYVCFLDLACRAQTKSVPQGWDRMGQKGMASPVVPERKGCIEQPRIASHFPDGQRHEKGRFVPPVSRTCLCFVKACKQAVDGRCLVVQGVGCSPRGGGGVGTRPW